jgi:hypothetical protein
VTGVGDLMQKTRNSQTQVGCSVAGRLEGWMTPCVIFIMHMVTRITYLLVEPQNQGRRFPGFGVKTGSSDLMIFASKSPRRFIGLGLKIKRTTVYRLQLKPTEGGRPLRFSNLLHLKVSHARISQSGLKTDGCVTTGGTCGIITDITSCEN